jgi:CRP-like cAMP-binding protein
MIERALPGIRATTTEQLGTLARHRVFAPGEFVFQQGGDVPALVVSRGYAAFRRTTVDGQQIALGIAAPGEVYGLICIADVPATVEMVAITELEADIWSGQDLRRLATTDPSFALAVIERQALWLNTMAERYDAYLRQGAHQRVLRVLQRHRDLFFGDEPVVARSLLPAFVGTSREMTGRVLRDLERDGVVARVGRTGLRLLRPEGLEEGR